MTQRIRIDDLVSGERRWVYHNDRKSHLLPESLLKEIKREAEENLWSNDPVHGRLLGHKLFQLLNGSGGLLDGLGKAQMESGEAATLGLQLPGELMNLPFEIMWDGAAFIGVSGNMPIIRQVSGRNRRKKTALENRPLRMLFMACSPQDTEPVLDFEGEEEAIVRQLEDERLPVEVRVEDSGSLNGLKFALRELGPIDIVHLTGHAEMGKSGPIFQMESETGFLSPATPAALWGAMHNQAPRMLFLSGCETGKSTGAAAVSFAQAMIRQGVRFVIGWGLPVGDPGATLFAGPLQEIPTLLIFDDIEQNLEQRGEGFWLQKGKAGVIQPFLEALPWAEGKTQLILTCRYTFILESKGAEWVSASLERIPLMALRGADRRNEKANLPNLAASPYHETYDRYSGGNPRLMEWFEALAQAGAVPDVARLASDLEQRGEDFIQEYLAGILVAAQEPGFQTFLAQAAVYRAPVSAAAFAKLGSPAFLERAVNLTLMEKEGEPNPVYWVMPLIQERQWARVAEPEAVHRIAYALYNAKLEAEERHTIADRDACLYHAEKGYSMKGCWKHAVVLSHYFFERALVREGVERLLPLRAYLPADQTAAYEEHEVTFLNNLASLLQATNRLKAAEPLMRRALAIDEASLGPKHPSTMIRAWNLLLFYHRGKNVAGFSKLLPSLMWFMEIKDEDLGSTDLRTMRDNLGQLLPMIQNAEEKKQGGSP